ncbi:MAG: chromate transporter [Bryobacterales bacterium]|nr:chromate transporter [Bryobacteraceae bacterium]MDW8129149.1 chromate transporter [Bryobacterales bacterium]
MPAVALRRLAALFLRVGNFTFGGGDPIMAALQRELVERRRWMSAEHYGLAFALARVTPGTNVLAFCAAAGWFVRGWLGALVAVPAASVPSAILVIVLTALYQELQGLPLAAGAIGGLLAAAVGMMLAAAWNLLRSRMRPGNRVRIAALTLGAILLLKALSFSPVAVLGLGAAVGAIWPGPPADREPREPS